MTEENNVIDMVAARIGLRESTESLKRQKLGLTKFMPTDMIVDRLKATKALVGKLERQLQQLKASDDFDCTCEDENEPVSGGTENVLQFKRSS